MNTSLFTTPEAGGGTPPPSQVWRSRRVQQLNPIQPGRLANDDNSHHSSVHMEDASTSQYNNNLTNTTRTSQLQPTNQSYPSSTHMSYASSSHPSQPNFNNDDDVSTLASVPVPQPASVNTSVFHSQSSDPPEETFAVPTSDQSVRSHPVRSSVNTQTHTSYRSASPYTLPDTIQLDNMPTPYSMTQPQPYVTIETFQNLNTTVQRLQQNLQEFQTSSNHQTTSIHRGKHNTKPCTKQLLRPLLKL